MHNRPTMSLSTDILQTTQVSERLLPECHTSREMPDATDCLLSQVLVPRASSTREIAVLETAMAGLALDDRHPVALELAASATSRQFLLRATSRTAQQHLTNQVQARYPQALIQKIEAEDDPLIQKEGEAVSVVELRAGAAAYLPLRTWRERELLHEGADPLLGVLAVFNHLPPQMRVVTQLALLPASPTWSAPFQRKALEHPLEPERLRDRRTAGGQITGPGTGQLIGLGILVALLLVWWRFQRPLTAHIPLWLRQAALTVLHGQTPVLTSAQVTTVIVIGLGTLVGLFCLAFVVFHMSSRLGKTPLYDMRLVGEKTTRPAYRVRLRLLVFETIPAHPSRQHEKPEDIGRWQRWSWSELRKSYQFWRRASQQARQHRQERADLLAQLMAAYRQYHTATGGYFLPHRLSRRQTHRLLKHTPQRLVFFAHQGGWQHGVRRSPHLLSVADVAALWHLPQTHDLAELPYVERGRARTLLAPVSVTQGHGWRLGTSIHAGQDVPVFLPAECLRHNLLTVASTGKGKSTLFQHLASAVLAARATSGGGDAEEGRNSTQAARGPSSSLAFIEPHGDGIQALLGRIPARERDNVVVIDLANADYPVGLNPLDMRGRDRDKVVDNLITLAEHLWESSYGSRTENVLEYALKTLADVNDHLIEVDSQQGPGRQYTLLDVVPLLRQPEFRHALFEQVRDEMLLDRWQHYYEPMDAHQQREVTSSVITKFSKFASSRRARRILGQPCSTIDVNAIIRAGHILLVSTASGVVGADLSELIGIVLLGFFESALSEQASLPPQERRRYLVLIDEFQVYRGANYQRMLAELRKYGGSFALATQSLSYLDRLDRTLLSTVLANIDHLFAFHMAGEDARLLHELDGIAEDDITNLDDFQCYVKLSLAGRRLPVFSLQLDAPPPSDEQVATDIRLRSQQRDGRPRGVVDTQLQHSRVRHHLTANPPRASAGRKSGKERPSAPEQSAAALDGNAADPVAGQSSPRKHRKQGGSSRKSVGETTPAPYQHIMYDEEEAASPSEHEGQQENKAVSTSPGEPGPLSRRLPRGQMERMALAASLDLLDWRLLSWLLRYPFQRADDLVVGLARWTSRATVYRHLHMLEQNGLVGSVLPKTPAEGKRLYHLSNFGLHLLAAHLDTPARTLARNYQTDEAGLLRLIPRLPLLLALQNVVNGLVTHAADALTVHGRRPILVRWNWQRDLSHRFRYREQSRRLLVDGAVALCVRTPVGDENWDEQWYGALLLSTPLEDERVLRMRLERLLCWRECPERWKSYQHMLPVLVLAHSSRQCDHWQRAMAQAMQQVGSTPLIGAVTCMGDGEKQCCNPWQLNWRTLSTESGCHLRDLLQPVPRMALPPALCPENDMVGSEGEAIALHPREASTCTTPAMAFVPTRLHRIITHNGAGYPVARSSQKQAGQERREEVNRREILAWLTWQLTPGSWQIIYLLLAHPLLSTEELAVFLGIQLHSVSCSLAALHRLGCIVPTRTAVGQRWYLDAQGLLLVAAANHIHLRTLALGGDESVTRDVPSSLTIMQRGVSWLLRHIHHTAGVYAFFAHLAQAAKKDKDHELCWWETGAVCERHYRVNEQWHNLRPDALAAYRVGQHRLQFWLEWDRGTMNGRDLIIKFTAYAEYLSSRKWGRDHTILPILVCVAPEFAQEQRIQRVASAVLTQAPGLVLATTTQTLLTLNGPLAAIWQVSGSQQHSSEGYARRLVIMANTEMVAPRSL